MTVIPPGSTVTGLLNSGPRTVRVRGQRRRDHLTPPQACSVPVSGVSDRYALLSLPGTEMEYDTEPPCAVREKVPVYGPPRGDRSADSPGDSVRVPGDWLGDRLAEDALGGAGRRMWQWPRSMSGC